jgi:hypothetical protein
MYVLAKIARYESDVDSSHDRVDPHRLRIVRIPWLGLEG